MKSLNELAPEVRSLTAEIEKADDIISAFAIMVQLLDKQTPAEFMDYPNTHKADVISLVKFLEEALSEQNI